MFFAANCNDYLLICPHDQTVGLGENVMFFCELKQTDYIYDEGIQIDWIIIINGTEYNMYQSNPLDELKELNFTLGTITDSSLSLEVEATVANNNSQIDCRILYLPNSPHVIITEATLTVVGKLAVQLYTLPVVLITSCRRSRGKAFSVHLCNISTHVLVYMLGFA